MEMGIIQMLLMTDGHSG